MPSVGVTNQAGKYTITPLTIGTYVVKAELAGFRTSATPPIAIEARQVARLDFKMTVGAIAETIEVVGASPILQTETSGVGPRYGEFRVEAFNALNIPSFGPPARDISVPNTFGIITNTISSPRVIELVFKVYF